MTDTVHATRAVPGVFVPFSSTEEKQVFDALGRRGYSMDGAGLRRFIIEEARRPGSQFQRLFQEATGFVERNPEAVRTLGHLARALVAGNARIRG